MSNAKLDEAQAHHRAGRRADAEAMYRAVLAEDAENFAALHGLGVCMAQNLRPDEAVEFIRRAIELKNDDAEFHDSLGIVLASQKKQDEAIAEFKRAISLQPNHARANYNLGVALMIQQKWTEAAEAFTRTVALQPEFLEAQNNLAICFHGLRRWDEVIALCNELIARHPNDYRAHQTLAAALTERGQLDEAIAAYQKAWDLNPQFPNVRRKLAYLLLQRNRVDEAEAIFMQLLQKSPKDPHILHALGMIDQDKGRIEAAVEKFDRAISFNASDAVLHVHRGTALLAMNRLDDAAVAYRTALTIDPKSAEAHLGLGNSLARSGRIGQAIPAFTAALNIDPTNAAAHSNLVFAMHFDLASDAPAISRELGEWNRRHVRPLRKYIRPLDNDRSPERKLRIGFVSPTFGRHSAGWNLYSFMGQRDREKFEIFAYATRDKELVWPEMVDAWRNIRGCDDEKAAEMIRADRIDILVDLSVHESWNRLLVFARRPAPVQATYLGYCSSTGVETIDYRLTDPNCDPQGTDLSVYSEKTIRLPRTFWCFAPPESSPGVSALPAEKSGVVTFGSLSFFPKISQPLLECWAELLKAIPNSRLLMHAPRGSCRELVQNTMKGFGISADRVETLDFQPPGDYLRTYQRIDIALDPFPFGGGVTSFDCLWMGVPFVTRLGRTAVGRGGASILNNVGLAELVARDVRKYIEVARALASDVPKLRELRATLRERFLASPLTDDKTFARDMESAFRGMWRQWCKEKDSP